jgi:hypothetical protein
VVRETDLSSFSVAYAESIWRHEGSFRAHNYRTAYSNCLRRNHPGLVRLEHKRIRFDRSCLEKAADRPTRSHIVFPRCQHDRWAMAALLVAAGGV